MNTTIEASPAAKEPTLSATAKMDLSRAFASCPTVSLNDRDDNLLVLGESVGALARMINSGHNPRPRLLSIAAFAMQWSRVAHGAVNPSSVASFHYALQEVFQERGRQQVLLAKGLISFDCASPDVSQARKYRVLMEEVGEVAEAIDRLEMKPGSVLITAELWAELVQVAAVCMAWMEALEAQGL